MTQANHYEPVPEQRPAWPAGTPAEGTPERWFEPSAEAEPPTAPPPVVGRGLIALLLATSMFGAVIGGGGMFLLLKQSGAMDAQALSTLVPTASVGVSVQSESDAIIAAAARVGPSVVTIVAHAPTGLVVGSGIIYDSAGWILTNKHVVVNARTIDVRLSDGRTFAGRLYGNDTLTDLSILKIDGALGLSAAPIGSSSSLRIGQLTIVIGSPLGVDYPNSVTSGIISALGRDVTITSDSSLSGTSLHGLIQTDAAISSGNSGGPLVDASGRVIGVTTILAESAQGIGFAIPIDIAKPIMQQALAGAKLARPFIGINYVAIDAGLAAKQKLPIDHGAWVHKEDDAGNSIEAVTKDGPADRAGIKTGDIITELEGQPIDATHPLEDYLVQYAPGRTISLEVLRGTTYRTILVTLGTRPESAS
jgi:S1-C subfamily serine protease